MPSFTNSIDVDPGDAILAAHVDNLADNTEFNRETAGVTLDMDTTTGDGFVWADADNPLVIKNNDGTAKYLSVALHQDSAGGDSWLLVRQGNQSTVTTANADGHIQLSPPPPGGYPA